MSSGHNRGSQTAVFPPPDMDDMVQPSLTAFKDPHAAISLFPRAQNKSELLVGILTLDWCDFSVCAHLCGCTPLWEILLN